MVFKPPTWLYPMSVETYALFPDELMQLHAVLRQQDILFSLFCLYFGITDRIPTSKSECEQLLQREIQKM